MTSDQRNYLRQRRQQPQTRRQHLCQLFGRRHLSLLFLVIASTTTLLWVSSARVYANTDQHLFAQTESILRLQLCSMGGVTVMAVGPLRHLSKSDCPASCTHEPSSRQWSG